MIMIHFNSQAQNDDQLQQSKDTAANIYKDLDSVNVILESLGDKVSRLSVSKHANLEEVEDRRADISKAALNAQLEGEVQNRYNVDTQIQAAQAQAEANKEQLVTKEEELQAARTEIQKQRESLDRISAALLEKGAEAEELRREIERLEGMDQDANVQIKALHTQILDLKKENEELDEDLQLAEAACDKQVRLANETADRREKMSRRGKRARGNDDGDDLTMSKRSKTGITTREESATELTSEHGGSASGGKVSFTT
jgi:chromosome segregation ATPase